jgi:hypothetical protein
MKGCALGNPVQLKAVRLGSVAVNSQKSTPGLPVHVSKTLPSPAVAVIAVGGSAVEPLSRHPTSNNVVTIAAINM